MDQLLNNGILNIIVKSNDEKTTIEGLNATANVTIAPAPEPEGE